LRRPENRILRREADELPVMKDLQRPAVEKSVCGGVRRDLDAQSPLPHGEGDHQPGDACRQTRSESQGIPSFA
jgi:hypothetical protein